MTSEADVPSGFQHLTGTVTDSSYVGVSTQYLVRTAWDTELSVFAPNSGLGGSLPPGAEVTVAWNPAHAFLLDRLDGAGDATHALVEERA